MSLGEQSITTSKLNLLGAFLAILGLFSDPVFQEYLGALLPKAYLSRIMALAGLLVMVLRTFFTSQPTSMTVKRSR